MTQDATREVTVHVDGVPIHVRRVGSGPNVLFVHGVYVNGRIWDAVVERLAPELTCWVPTLPFGGHRDPAPSNWAPSLDGLAGLIPRLIEALDLDDVTVVSNDSGGGFVLLALGGKSPALDRVRALVFTNCDSFDHLPPKAFNPIVGLCRRAPWLARGLLWLMLHTIAGRKGFIKSVSRTPITAHQRNEWFGSRTTLGNAVAVTAALRPSPEQSAMNWLVDVRTPSYLIWGDADKFFPPGDAERLHQALTGSSLRWVPGAKTYLQLDAVDEVAAVVREAVARR